MNLGCFNYASGSSYDGNWDHNIYVGVGTYIVWFMI